MKTRPIWLIAFVAVVAVWSSLVAMIALDRAPAPASPSIALPDQPMVVADLPDDPKLAARTTRPIAVAAEPRSWAPTVDGLRVVMPRLGIDLPLAMGDMERDIPRTGYAGSTPEHVALVFPSDTLPGGAGNTYVYAHARTGMFLNLWNARLNDSVLIVRADGALVREYRVDQIVPRVDPSDVRWLDSAGPERLTLQTSTGPRPQDPRFVVVAYPVGTLAMPARAP